MSLNPTNRRCLAALRPLVLSLCVSIFVWVLHSKLSGYDTPTHLHSKSVAKLIQDDFATKRIGKSAPAAGRSVFQPFVDFSFVLFHPRLIVRRSGQVQKPPPSPIPSYPFALRFRPPPSII
jgi:hypothetical protein